MKVEHLGFPNDLKRKLTARISNSIKAQFYGGANITTDRFNIALVEPFKIVFTKRNNNVVIFVVSKKNDDRTAYEFFIGGIDKSCKCSMTGIINFVNENL